MRRLMPVLLITALAVPSPAAGAEQVWDTPLALGPYGATSVAARQGLLLAGGAVPQRDGFNGPEPIPSPRVPGIFRSEDGGRTWSRGAELVEQPDGTFAPEPIERTPDLVGAPEGTDDAYAAFGSEVWRSGDDGAIWARAATIAGTPSTLAFLRDGRSVAGLASGGLLVSGDRGTSWSAMGTGLPSARVNQVLHRSDQVVLVATDAGLYRSADAGATFSLVETGIADPDAPALGIAGEGTLGTYLTMPGSSLIGTLVYYSSNEGATFQPRTPIYSQNLLPRMLPGALTFAVQGLITRLYAGTPIGLFRTTLTSSTAVVIGWERLDPLPGAEQVSAVAVADADPGPRRDDAVYGAVRRASVAVATTGGGSLAAPGWFDELEGGRVCGGLVIHTTGDLIAACGRHVLRSSDAGATWADASAGLPYVSAGLADSPYMPLRMSADGSLWASGFHYGLYRSDAEVTSWSKVAFPAASVGHLATHPADPAVAYAAGGATNGASPHGVWRTTDAGATWTPVTGIGPTVTSISVTPVAPDRVVISSSTGAFVSEDSGETWIQVQGLPPGAGVFVSQADPETWWAARIEGQDRILYRSGDDGESWDAVGPIPFGTLVASPWDADSLYVTTSTQGFAVSRDGGRTWTTLSSGIAGGAASNLTLVRDEPGAMWGTSGTLGFGADPPHLWVQRGVDPAA